MLWAQDHLRILSGLYGLLRPLDAIQAYRLEMGSRLANDSGATLYDYWGDTLALALNAQAAKVGGGVVVNCASVEYFSAVDLKALTLPVITPSFLRRQRARRQDRQLLRQKGARRDGAVYNREPTERSRRLGRVLHGWVPSQRRIVITRALGV